MSDHDQIPYVSMPVSYSEPGRLAAMAALHGHAAPPAERARVLEIGCASGGNIVPLAARFADARFLGIDISRRHVDMGRQRIARLGLTNIEIRQGDITAVEFPPDSFDYIICHGVWSWVPEAARQAVLRICRTSLTPDGIAAISYNVLPGWNLRRILRDMCLEHAGTGTARDRVERTRKLLELMAATANKAAKDAYSVALQTDAARLAKRPASYLLGELLAENNEAFSVRRFLSDASAHGLVWLAEADLASTLTENLAPHAAAHIEATAGDPISMQALADYFSGRMFRRTLLRRAAQDHAHGHMPSARNIGSLHLAASLTWELDSGGRTGATFRDHRRVDVPAPDAAVVAAFKVLGGRFPSTASVGEILAAAQSACSTEPAAVVAARVERAVFGLLARGSAVASSLPLATGTGIGTKPRTWRIAHEEAGSEQPWVTSLRHAAVVASPATKLLLRAMDGSRDRDALADLLDAAEHSGNVRREEPAGPHGPEPTGSRSHGATRDRVDRAIDDCARRGLLEQE